MKTSNLLSVTVLCAVVGMLMLGTATPAHGQAAIFTTVNDGSGVNVNLFNYREDVYLNGGPQGGAPSGLPDGVHYFIVTTPSGFLLSTDYAVCRQLTVSGGVVAGATGPCPHANGIMSPNGSIPVQLYPFNFTTNPGGEYKAWLVPASCVSPPPSPTDFQISFSQSCAKTDNFKVRETGGVPPPPQEIATITGTKFYDLNTNGTQDGSEVGIDGWRIERVPPSPSVFTFTTGGGQYTFTIEVPDGIALYTVSEVPPPPGWFPSGNWINTTATSGQVNVTGAGSFDGPDFGNVCLGPGGGHTIGFWRNKNGQALISGSDLTALSGLNLVDEGGNPFDPGSNAALADWLKKARAVNMAYMLSAQLAAMKLNVLEPGFVTGAALVYSGVDPAGCPDVASDFGFVSVDDLMTAADTALGSDPVTPSGDEPNRSCQEFLKNALDNANNNATFVQPGPASCPFTTPY